MVTKHVEVMRSLQQSHLPSVGRGVFGRHLDFEATPSRPGLGWLLPDADETPHLDTGCHVLDRFRPQKPGGGSYPYYYVLDQLGFDVVVGQRDEPIPRRNPARLRRRPRHRFAQWCDRRSRGYGTRTKRSWRPGMTWSFRWFGNVGYSRADQGLCSPAVIDTHRPGNAPAG